VLNSGDTVLCQRFVLGSVLIVQLLLVLQHHALQVERVPGQAVVHLEIVGKGCAQAIVHALHDNVFLTCAHFPAHLFHLTLGIFGASWVGRLWLLDLRCRDWAWWHWPIVH